MAISTGTSDFFRVLNEGGSPDLVLRHETEENRYTRTDFLQIEVVDGPRIRVTEEVAQRLGAWLTGSFGPVPVYEDVC